MPKTATDSKNLAGKKLGIMVAAEPGRKNFEHAVNIAAAAAAQNAEVFIYFIDEAVRGLSLPSVQGLSRNRVRVFGCAFSLQRRRLPMNSEATMVGLTMLNEIMTQTDRFLAFT